MKRNKILIALVLVVIGIVVFFTFQPSPPNELLDRKIMELAQDGTITSQDAKILDPLFAASPDCISADSSKGQYILGILANIEKSNICYLNQKKISTTLYAHIFLDNSASMMGYATKAQSNKFVEALIDLTRLFERNKTKGYLMEMQKGGIEIVPRDIDSFVKFVSTPQSPYMGSTPLDQFFSEMIHKIRDSDRTKENIAIFITDGIPSGTDNEIKQYRDFNKSRAKELTSRIESQFRGENLATSVYRFVSDFDGGYCTFNNKIVPYKGLRPFFVFVVGNRDRVAEVKQKILCKDSNIEFNFIDQAHFGLESYPVGVAVTCNDGGDDLNQNGAECFFRGADNLAFNIGISKLPDYVKKKEYLIDSGNFLLKVNGKDVLIPKTSVKDNQISFVLSKNEILSHTIEDKMSIEILIKNRLPQWCLTKSCSDDSRPTSDNTFNLRYLIDGLMVLDKNSASENGLYYVKYPYSVIVR